MKILTTSTADQTIRIIPRSYPTDLKIVLRDDSTNEEVTYVPNSYLWNLANIEWDDITILWNEVGGSSVDKGYLVITNQYNLVEGRYYDLTIKTDLDEVIYKDKIFCTDQSIDEANNEYYTVNKNQYTEENTYDKDYIIL